ncbi:MAG: TonB-dependent receptor, partial [Pseudomonadota bacterium]
PAIAQDIIDIPAQPLSYALVELGTETGLQVVAPPAAIEGLMSKAVHGPMTPHAALREMLSGTGLTIHTPTDNGAVLSFSDVVSQNAIDDEAFDLGTLVLRGELIERDVQDSQTSVVVVTGDELDERGETSLSQTLNRIPGVNAATGVLTIRGIPADGNLGVNNTLSSTISVTTDGIRLSDFRNTGGPGAISNWDVEQVEVFRGSQSTQTGRNALAGAVVVEGAKPQFFPEYRVRLGFIDGEGFSDGPGYQTALVLNTPLIEDQLAARLSVDRRDTDGRDGVNQQTIRAGLLYEPTDRLSFGLTYSDIDNEGGGTTLDLWSPRLTADYAINDALTFSWRGQYTDVFTTFATNVGGRERDYETFDQEVRLLYETDRVRAVGGLFYTSIDEFSVLRGSMPGVVTATVDEDNETENFAIYGEVEYDLTPQWTVIAGLRYDVEDVKSSQTLDGVLFGILISSNASLDTTYDALLPKLGVVYNFNEDRSLGLTYQRGYRAGGIGISIPPTGGAASTFEFDPEFTDTVELAYRSKSSDGRRTLNANVYYTQWTDQQVLSTDAIGNFAISNTADSDLWGAELEYRQLVNDNLDVFVSAAFNQSEYGDYVDGGVQVGGNSFPNAPEVAALLGANYTFDNGLSIGGDVTYTSRTFSDPSNLPQFENDGYWVTNVNASYVFANDWVLTAYVRNLFDESYTITQSPTFTQEGAEREFGVFVTANF